MFVVWTLHLFSGCGHRALASVRDVGNALACVHNVGPTLACVMVLQVLVLGM